MHTVYAYVCTSVSIHISTYVRMYVRMYVCLCVHVYCIVDSFTEDNSIFQLMIQLFPVLICNHVSSIYSFCCFSRVVFENVELSSAQPYASFCHLGVFENQSSKMLCCCHS